MTVLAVCFATIWFSVMYQTVSILCVFFFKETAASAISIIAYILALPHSLPILVPVLGGGFCLGRGGFCLWMGGPGFGRGGSCLGRDHLGLGRGSLERRGLGRGSLGSGGLGFGRGFLARGHVGRDREGPGLGRVGFVLGGGSEEKRPELKSHR